MKKDNKNRIVLNLLSLFIFLFFISFVSAQLPNLVGGSSIESSIGNIKQSDVIQLTQLCQNCSYVNLTQVIYPNNTYSLLGQFSMTKNGTNFNYTYSDTNTLGKYFYTTCGNLNGDVVCQSIGFEVTPSGQGGNANIVFFIFIILLLYGITFAGFFGKNIPITILGGMALLFLGVYLVNNGIIIYRDTLTNYIAYVTIAVGGITAFWAILEQFDVL